MQYKKVCNILPPPLNFLFISVIPTSESESSFLPSVSKMDADADSSSSDDDKKEEAEKEKDALRRPDSRQISPEPANVEDVVIASVPKCDDDDDNDAQSVMLNAAMEENVPPSSNSGSSSSNKNRRSTSGSGSSFEEEEQSEEFEMISEAELKAVNFNDDAHL